MAAVRPRPGRWIGLVLSIALTLVIGAVGGLATASSVGSWYAALNKPPFNPPNWIFGPVWTTLYVMMAVAAWLIWLTPRSPERTVALRLYGLQLALNLAWSVLFFGMRAPLLALADLTALIVAVLATLAVFWRLRRPAALLLVPYLAWSSFAFALNFEIWRLNPGG